MIPARVVVGVVLTLLALLVLVIVVGLARNNLNPNGVAAVLSTMFSGIVVGALTAGRKRDE